MKVERLLAQIREQLLVRKGEVMDEALADERARNIVTALSGPDPDCLRCDGTGAVVCKQSTRHAYCDAGDRCGCALVTR